MQKQFSEIFSDYYRNYEKATTFQREQIHSKYKNCLVVFCGTVSDVSSDYISIFDCYDIKNSLGYLYTKSRCLSFKCKVDYTGYDPSSFNKKDILEITGKIEQVEVDVIGDSFWITLTCNCGKPLKINSSWINHQYLGIPTYETR